MKKIVLLFAVALLAWGIKAQNTYFPPKGSIWEIRLPSEFDIDKPNLDIAVEFAEGNEYSGSHDLRIAILEGFKREPYHTIAGPTKKRGGPAGIILKNGYIIAQWGEIERVDMTFSVTKSYLSTVFGVALDEGLIPDVNDKVGNLVWDGTFDGVHNSKITWKHCLNQTSDWSGELFGMKDWADRPPVEGGIDDWKNRELYEPGTFFKYNDVRVNVLAYSLLQVWRKPLPQVLKEKVMDPIGASSTWRWFGYENSWTTLDGLKLQSVSGGGHSGGGLFINTLDHARFGLLFMNNGKWNGKQLVSEKWVKMVAESAPANQSYGLMWWLNKGDRKMEGVPENIFYAAGFGGNYIVVDQRNQMVIVTRWLEPSKLGEFMKLVYNSFQ